jgi:hypothetical protein
MNFILLRRLNLEICTVLKFTKEGRKFKQHAVEFMTAGVVCLYTEIGLVRVFENSY